MIPASAVLANNELNSESSEINAYFFSSVDNWVSNKNHVCNKSYDVSSRNW